MPRRAAVVEAWEAEVRARLAGRSTAVPPAAWCGRALAAFEDVALRDALLLSAGSGPRTERARALLLAGAGASAQLVGAAVQEVDARRAALAAGLAVDVARHAEGRAAAGAWAVAAWLHWSAGDGLRAGGCAQLAVERDPAHRLGRLVAQAVGAGLPARGR
nr:DUF4192 family protein [Kineococcus vitellinus]